jgi:hypothetical protein
MRSVLLAAVLVASTATPMHGADCTVPAFKFFFGQRSSASITAGSGYTCHLYLNEKPGAAQSARVSALPRHGTVTAHGNDIAYRSAPGFTGRDQFTFRVVRGVKTATIEVIVSVKELDGAPLPPTGPIGLSEYTPWLAHIHGPEQAVGAFYFIRGFVPRARDDDRHHGAQYFLQSLSDAGWDVFNGKYPHDLAYPGNEDAHERVAEFVRNRVKELNMAPHGPRFSTMYSGHACKHSWRRWRRSTARVRPFLPVIFAPSSTAIRSRASMPGGLSRPRACSGTLTSSFPRRAARRG